MAKVTNIIEAAATCQRNMFSGFKIAIKFNTKITYTVSKDVRKEEMSKFAALPRCTYNY